MRMSSKGLLAAAVAFVAFATLAPEVMACTEQCVKVAPLCRRCLDVGTPTLATCQDSGACGCFYTQNACGLLTSNVFGESVDQPAEATAVADASSSCLASADPLAVATE
jgi:hypothetical protein